MRKITDSEWSLLAAAVIAIGGGCYYWYRAKQIQVYNPTLNIPLGPGNPTNNTFYGQGVPGTQTQTPGQAFDQLALLQRGGVGALQSVVGNPTPSADAIDSVFNAIMAGTLTYANGPTGYGPSETGMGTIAEGGLSPGNWNLQ